MKAANCPSSRFSVLALLVFVAIVGVACSGGQPKPSPTRSPEPAEAAAPSEAATAQPCPVDQAVCDFSAGIEGRLRKHDAAGLGDPQGGASLLDMLLVTGGPIRLVGIGCPQSPDGIGDTCANGFVLAFSSLPDGLEQKDSRGQVVVGFARQAGDIRAANNYAFPEGDQRRIVLEGGDVSDCRISQFLGPMVEGYCRRVTFHPFRTPVLPQTPPVTKPPLADIPGVTVRELTPGPPSSIPPGGVVYYTPQCWGCGGLRMPALFRFATGDREPVDLLPDMARSRVVTWAADWDRGDIYLGICGWPAACIGISYQTEPRKFILHSVDGGVTWTDIGSLPDRTMFVGVVGGELIAMSFKPAPGLLLDRVWRYQSDFTIQPPQTPAPAVPLVLNSASLVWRTEDNTYYDQAGGVLFSPLFADRKPISQILADPQYLHNFVRWSGDSSKTKDWASAPWYDYLGLVDQAGQMREAWAWYGPGYEMQIAGAFPGERSAPTQLFGNISVAGGAPQAAIYDLPSSSIRPIPLPDTRPEGTFPLVLHISRYPFAQVVGTNDCLNLRAEPSPSAQVLLCVADNVILRVDGGVVDAGDVSWLQVRTPAGQHAWAARQYLDLR